jgi:hypothetical protein
MPTQATFPFPDNGGLRVLLLVLCDSVFDTKFASDSPCRQREAPPPPTTETVPSQTDINIWS